MFTAKSVKTGNVIDMMALRRELGSRVAAREFLQADEFVCKHCGQPARGAAGLVRAWYFAHKSDASECPITRMGKESEDHSDMKRIISDYAQKQFKLDPSAIEFEKRLDLDGQLRIADVYVETSSGPIAFEVQISSLTLEAFIQRTSDYDDNGIWIYWVFRRGHKDVNHFSDSTQWYKPHIEYLRRNKFSYLTVYIGTEEIVTPMGVVKL